MKLQQLRAFVAVAEHRSIRAAARALFVSQPAVTRTMRELEADLDVPLLRRSVAGVELTEAGLAFQSRAQLILEELRRARDELAYMKAGGNGRVTAALTSTIGLTLLPDALKAFGRRMPQAQVGITEDAPTVALEKLKNGTLDFVVANTLEGSLPDDFSQQPLFLMQLVVSARSGHPMAAARSLRELQEQEWVVPSLNRDFFSRLFISQGLEVPPRMLACESFAIALHLLGKMDLLGLFSSAVIEQELLPRGLQALHLRERLPPVEVSIVTLRQGRLTPAAQCLVECLQSVPPPRGLKRTR